MTIEACVRVEAVRLYVAFLFVRHGKLPTVNIRRVARTCQPQTPVFGGKHRAKWEALAKAGGAADGIDYCVLSRSADLRGVSAQNLEFEGPAGPR